MDISFITVFLQGLISFFSPCVLPLLPVYMGYLSGGTLGKAEDGTTHYDKKKVMINTLFFVIGVSFAFFLLGMGLSALGMFFMGNQMVFTRIGGVIVILFGIYHLGILGPSMLLNKEVRLPIDFGKLTASPLTALLMGFVISFAWSPCIGPILSSVLIMAASSQSASTGFLLIGVYTLGYVIPFLLVGVFTTSLLEFFGKHRSIVKYSAKIGGILMILMGILMFTGKLNSISSYLSQFNGPSIEAQTENQAETQTEVKTEDIEIVDTEKEAAQPEDKNKDLVPAPDFTLTDQYGNEHTLSDYKGKIVFLNFWATWCPPCRAEMPDIQKLYEEYSALEDSDVEILAVAFPNYGDEKDVEGVKEFLDENGYTYPVLMDEGASLMLPYYITAYPTTFIIDKEGYVLGYIPGSMTKDIMEAVISQARE